MLLYLSMPPAPKSAGALRLGLDASQERVDKTGLSGFEQNMHMSGIQKYALFQGKCMENHCKRPQNAGGDSVAYSKIRALRFSYYDYPVFMEM
jgi:hypothetical protein